MEGGVGAFTQELGRALHAAGHDIHIITSRAARPPQSGPQSQSLGETFRKLSDIHEPVPIPIGQLHARGRRWRWAEMTMIADLVSRYEFDVVNVQYQASAFNMRSLAINLLPWRLRGMTRTVVTFHDLRVPYLFPKAGRLRTQAVRMMAKRADGVIVTNRPDGDQLRTWGVEPVAEIPIGSNIAVHQPNHIELHEARDDLQLPDTSVLLAYFGFVNESKGIDTLIEALGRLPKKVHLVCIGGHLGASDAGNNRLFLERIKQLIDVYKLGDRVHWTGFLSDRRVSTYFELADVVVLPYKDGVSLRRGTLMAAMAHGRPIISTIPTHPPELLTDGENIRLVPPENAAALAGMISDLIGDDDQRAVLGQGAAAVSQRFLWPEIARETVEFYRTLLIIN